MQENEFNELVYQEFIYFSYQKYPYVNEKSLMFYILYLNVVFILFY